MGWYVPCRVEMEFKDYSDFVAKLTGKEAEYYRVTVFQQLKVYNNEKARQRKKCKEYRDRKKKEAEKAEMDAIYAAILRNYQGREGISSDPIPHSSVPE